MNKDNIKTLIPIEVDAMPIPVQGSMCSVGEKLCFVSSSGVYMNDVVNKFHGELLDVGNSSGDYRCICTCRYGETDEQRLYIIGTESGMVKIYDACKGVISTIVAKKKSPVMSIKIVQIKLNKFLLGISNMNQEMTYYYINLVDNEKECVNVKEFMAIKGKKESDPLFLSQSMYNDGSYIYSALGGTSGYLYFYIFKYDESLDTLIKMQEIRLRDHKSEISSVQIISCNNSSNNNTEEMGCPSSLALLTTGLDTIVRLYSIKLEPENNDQPISLDFLRIYKCHLSGVSGSCFTKKLLCTIGLDGLITYFRIERDNLQEIRTISIDKELLNIVPIENKGLFVVQDVTGVIHIVDHKGIVQPSFTGFQGSITQIKNVSYGTIASSADGTVRVLDHNGNEFLRPIVHGFPVKTFVLLKQDSLPLYDNYDDKNGDVIVMGSEETVIRTLSPSKLASLLIGKSQKENIKENFNSILQESVSLVGVDNAVCYAPSALELEPRALYKNDIEKISDKPKLLNDPELAHFTLFGHEISGGISNCRCLRISPLGSYIVGRTIVNPKEPSDLYIFHVSETVVENEDYDFEEYYRRQHMDEEEEEEEAREKEQEKGERTVRENNTLNNGSVLGKEIMGKESEKQNGTKRTPSYRLRAVSESPYVSLTLSEQILDVDFLWEHTLVTVSILGLIHCYKLNDQTKALSSIPTYLKGNINNNNNTNNSSGIYHIRRLGNNIIFCGGNLVMLLEPSIKCEETLNDNNSITFNSIQTFQTHSNISVVETSETSLALGFMNGSICVYNYSLTLYPIFTSGVMHHTSPVSAISLVHDMSKYTLISGAQDGSIIYWG